eukprot:TRINITY_DN5635_c0_g1_i4.p1 TRINITY_DN5635_c0_g1~~TRINITY_DN5635_c0_g1_i4.p1  ORF type:complete len:283 (+),score=14.87 TRINITY_DN5635_c0_g1_i4:428-1276(+)
MKRHPKVHLINLPCLQIKGSSLADIENSLKRGEYETEEDFIGAVRLFWQAAKNSIGPNSVLHKAIYELAVTFHAMSQRIIHGKIQTPSGVDNKTIIGVVKESAGGKSGELRESMLADTSELEPHISKKKLSKELLSTQAAFVRALNSGTFLKRPCKSPIESTASPNKLYFNTSKETPDNIDRYTTCKPFRPIELQPMIPLDTTALQNNDEKEVQSEQNKGDYINISVQPIPSSNKEPMLDIKLMKEHPQALSIPEETNRGIKINEPEPELSYTESGIAHITH